MWCRFEQQDVIVAVYVDVYVSARNFAEHGFMAAHGIVKRRFASVCTEHLRGLGAVGIVSIMEFAWSCAFHVGSTIAA